MMKKPRVIFVTVRDNAAKLNAICQQVERSFDRKEPILIAVPNTEAANYVDQLLWKMPEESFLPHQIALSQTNELVAITMGSENVNRARILLNLCSNVSPIFHEFEMIYEFYDETQPAKADSSLQRKNFYMAQSCFME